MQDVGELDPLPHAPHHHGSGHSGVLRDFFRKYRGVGGAGSGSSPAGVAATAGNASVKATATGDLHAEAQRLCISVRLLSGSLGAFDYERLALERTRREAVAAAAAREAAAAGADASGVAAAAAAATKAAASAVGSDTEGNVRWARPTGWWARGPRGTTRLTA